MKIKHQPTTCKTEKTGIRFKQLNISLKMLAPWKFAQKVGETYDYVDVSSWKPSKTTGIVYNLFSSVSVTDFSSEETANT